jgi:hypothetical protein
MEQCGTTVYSNMTKKTIGTNKNLAQEWQEHRGKVVKLGGKLAINRKDSSNQ